MKFKVFYLIFALSMVFYIGCGREGLLSTTADKLEKAETPVISKPTGTYDADFAVTITCSTTGAEIYYTLDGSNPNANSTLYSGAVDITGNGSIINLRAVAICSNYSNSSIASETYTILYENSVFIDPTASAGGDGSYSSPYNSWSSVTFQAGYGYLQKRGTVARETITVNVSGTAGNPVFIGAYDPGSKPIIRGSEIETIGWTPSSPVIYSKTMSTVEGLGMVTEDGTPLDFIEWDSDASTTFASASAGSYSYYNLTKVFYVWCSDSKSPDTHTMEVSERYYGIRGVDVSYIDIANIQVENTSLHGIVFEHENTNSAAITTEGNINITNCLVQNIGGATIGTDSYAGNGIEFGNSMINCTVNNSTISNIFDSGISPQTYNSIQSASNFTFSNSTIEKCGFAGVEVAALYNSGMIDSSISDVTLSNLTIQNCGKGFSGIRYGSEGRGIKIAADVVSGDTSRSISNVNISQCSVSGSEGEGIFIGGNSGTVTIERTAVSDNELEGILVQEGEPDTVTTMLKLNTSLIYDNGSNGGSNNKVGISYNIPDGQGYEILNCTLSNNQMWNLLASYGSSNSEIIKNCIFHFDSFTDGTNKHLYVHPSPSLNTNSEIKNNFFTEFNSSDRIIYIQSNELYYASQLNSITVSSVNIASGNVGDSDPLLNSDFTIKNSSSPCYQAGTNISGISVDYSGNSFGNPPSIGAYEF